MMEIQKAQPSSHSAQFTSIKLWVLLGRRLFTNKGGYDRLGKDAAINAGPFDALFSANSLHIMSAGSVTDFFLGAGKMLAECGLLIVYGPFNYQGKFTSPSNEEFDGWLKERNPVSGIRDFETVCSIADIANFELARDIDLQLDPN